MSTPDRKAMLERNHPMLSILRAVPSARHRALGRVPSGTGERR